MVESLKEVKQVEWNYCGTSADVEVTVRMQ